MHLPYKSEFKIVSEFGKRTDPITGENNSWHGGIDIVSNGDKTVNCVSGGKVVRSRIVTDLSDRTSEWGNYVAVQFGDTVFYYCHLSKRFVSDGDIISEGDALGIEGSTGRSTGSHLHFEIRKNSVQINPAEYLGLPNKAGFVYRPQENNSWSEEAVNWAIGNGILIGDVNGVYRLKDGATREEIVVMLHRFYKLINQKS